MIYEWFFELSPWVQTLLVGGGLTIPTYLLGKSHAQDDQEEVIARTVEYLCDNNYIKYEQDENGDIVNLIPLHWSEKVNGTKSTN